MDIFTKQLTYFNWSSGKDAAMALYELQKDEKFDIKKLVTTVNSHYDRVSMHGLRTELLIAQSETLGIPLDMILLPKEPSMKEYESIMHLKVNKLKGEGFTHCGFGDLFLEDLKRYREEKLKQLGINCIFPLWEKDTTQLVHELIKNGFKTMIICLDSRKLDPSFLGRVIDKDFLNDLPKDVDPCGENGEFHTFCFDAPNFKNPIPIELGEKTLRTYDITKDNGEKEQAGYWFLDILLNNSNIS